jgi:hypothetical protein
MLAREELVSRHSRTDPESGHASRAVSTAIFGKRLPAAPVGGEAATEKPVSESRCDKEAAAEKPPTGS